MEKLIRIAEEEIRRDPAMWFWVHDRWKDGKRRYRDRKHFRTPMTGN